MAEYLERLDNKKKDAKESFKHLSCVLAFIILVYGGYSWAMKKLLNNEILPFTVD